jgi:hypothetical protein
MANVTRLPGATDLDPGRKETREDALEELVLHLGFDGKDTELSTVFICLKVESVIIFEWGQVRREPSA